MHSAIFPPADIILKMPICGYLDLDYLPKCFYIFFYLWSFLVAQEVKNPAVTAVAVAFQMLWAQPVFFFFFLLKLLILWIPID